MSTKSQTEDEFKKILKNLFTEKKKTKDSKEQGKEKNPKEKFHAKVEKLQTLAFEEELLQVKAALLESEKQRQILHLQVEKSKPALQKLNQDCQELQKKNTLMQEENKEQERLLQERKANFLQEQGAHHEELEKSLQEKALLEKKYEKIQKILAQENEERELLQGNYEQLEKAFKQNQRHFREQSEEHFSEMRIMQERVASMEYQLKQTDLAKVHEEYEQKIEQCRKEHKELTEQLNHRMTEALSEKELATRELFHIKQNVISLIEKKERGMEEKLQEGYQSLQEWIDKSEYLEEERGRLLAALEEKSRLLMEKQEAIVLFQKGVEELTQRVEEGEAEVHKAQLHLAKKVKESALFQDVAQRQKEQLIEEQKRVSQERELRIQLERSLENYQQNEDKLKSFTEDCNKEAKAVIRKLEEYIVQLEKEIEKQQIKIGELEKYQEGYEKLLTIFNGLK